MEGLLMTKKRTSMADIATPCGDMFPTATVSSRVQRRRPVSAPTRIKVLTAIDELATTAGPPPPCPCRPPGSGGVIVPS